MHFQLRASISLSRGSPLIDFQCRLTSQTKACDACQHSGTTLRCFEFRLEHLVDQILDCEKLIMTRIHHILELTITMKVTVTSHGFCVGTIEYCLSISLSRSTTARRFLVYLALSYSRSCVRRGEVLGFFIDGPKLSAVSLMLQIGTAELTLRYHHFDLRHSL